MPENVNGLRTVAATVVAVVAFAAKSVLCRVALGSSAIRSRTASKTMWGVGIGFTMSLFIATLAFEGTTLLDSAKVGILGASILSGVVGAMVVRRGTRSA